MWPKQKFFFRPKVSSPPPLLNVREVKNAGANPQPCNIENRGGSRKLVDFGLFDNKSFFWPHIFAVIVDIKDHKISRLFAIWNSLYAYFNGNIPSKIFYFSIGSEILRLARNNSDRITFIMLVYELLGAVSKQGRQKRDIMILLNKIFGRHFEVSSKFAAAAKGLHIIFKL